MLTLIFATFFSQPIYVDGLFVVGIVVVATRFALCWFGWSFCRVLFFSHLACVRHSAGWWRWWWWCRWPLCSTNLGNESFNTNAIVAGFMLIALWPLSPVVLLRKAKCHLKKVRKRSAKKRPSRNTGWRRKLAKWQWHWARLQRTRGEFTNTLVLMRPVIYCRPRWALRSRFSAAERHAPIFDPRQSHRNDIFIIVR